MSEVYLYTIGSRELSLVGNGGVIRSPFVLASCLYCQDRLFVQRRPVRRDNGPVLVHGVRHCKCEFEALTIARRPYNGRETS